MDSRLVPAAALALGAVVVWIVWSQGGIAKHDMSETAFSDVSFDPYAHWRVQRHAGFIRHYPDRVGPTCLSQAIAEESVSLTMASNGLDTALENDGY